MRPSLQWSTALAVLCVVGMLAFMPHASFSMTASASGPNSNQRITPNGPSSCLDVPVASAIVHPTSCWVTGPTSIVVAGTDPRNAQDGTVVVVQEQSKRTVTLNGAGRLRISAVQNGRACVTGGSGADVAVDVATGNVQSSCNSVASSVSSASRSAAFATKPAAATLAAASASAPMPSNSYYVYGSYVDACGPTATTTCSTFNDGAAEPVPSTGGMAILDFGAPCFDPNTLAWGTQLFNSQSCTPDSEILTLAQAWVRGYETNPNRSASSAYILVVGTSNSLTAAVPGFALTPAQMTAHGQAWYQAVVKPLASGTVGLAAPVRVWSGSDIEESSDGNWYDATPSRAWVDGYTAASGATKPCVSSRTGLMADYGDYVPNQPGWSAGDVYWVAWGSASACPVPEIYYNGNAANWQSLNQWAQSVGAAIMQFTGVLSENGAAPGSLSASGSWSSLQSVTGQSAPYLSIIGGLSIPAAQPPDAPTGVAAVGGASSATVNWTAPAWDGGVKITAYIVTPYVGSTAQTATTVTGSPPAIKTVISGLTNGTTYTFKVAAQNAAGVGPQSAASNPITPVSVPGAPTLVQALAGDIEATVTWTPPASNGGSAINSYTVVASPGGASVTVSAVTPAATITGLTNGAPYTFTVTATNGAGPGPASAASAAVTPLAVAKGGAVAALPSMASGAYGGYLTVAYLENVGSTPAHIRVQNFDTSGSPVGTGNSAAGLPAGATWTLRSDNAHSLGPGQPGSAFVYSDQPLAIFVNEFAPNNSGDASSYSSIALPGGTATAIYAPTILNNGYGGYTTGIGLINTGSAATDVRITYRDGSGTTVKTQTLVAVAANSYQGLYSGDPALGLPAGFVGTATIESTSVPAQPLAAVINEVGPSGQFSSYDAVPAGSTTLYAPAALKNAYGGYNTGIGIQNTSATAGSVAITYFDSGGTATTHNFNLAAKGYLGIYQGTDIPAAGAYTAAITSTVPIAAIVNEVAPPQGAAQAFTSYNPFAAGSSSLNLPLVESAGADGWSTGEGIMNTGAAATTVTVTYHDSVTGAQVGSPQTMLLQPNASWGLYQPTGGLASGTRVSAVVTAGAGGQVAVVCNESNATSFMSYIAQ